MIVYEYSCGHVIVSRCWQHQPLGLYYTFYLVGILAHVTEQDNSLNQTYNPNWFHWPNGSEDTTFYQHS